MKERIRKLRKYFDLTQQEFADRIGIKRNTIAGYEIGRNNPIDPIITLICKEFKVNEEWLRTGQGEMLIADPSDELDTLSAKYNLTHGDYVLIEKFINMKQSDRRIVIDYIKEVGNALNDDISPDYPAIDNTIKMFGKNKGKVSARYNSEQEFDLDTALMEEEGKNSDSFDDF